MWHRKTGLDGHQRNRRWWLDVGLALIEGKDKDNRKVGQKFSEWVVEMFPGIDLSNTVPASIWLATNFVRCTENAPADMTHPKHLRDWFNEQQALAALPVDALWLAGNWEAVSRSPGNAAICTPGEIRRECRERELTSNLPEDLQSITPEATTVLPERDGERVASEASGHRQRSVRVL